MEIQIEVEAFIGQCYQRFHSESVPENPPLSIQDPSSIPMEWVVIDYNKIPSVFHQ